MNSPLVIERLFFGVVRSFRYDTGFLLIKVIQV